MEDQEIINEFLIESTENLARLDQEMVELEQRPDNPSLLASVFRTIHTIKGTCGFLSFSKLESISHIGENLLSKLRDGELRLTHEVTSGLLAMVDAIRQILTSIEQSGKENDTDYSSLISQLSKLLIQEKLDEPISEEIHEIAITPEEVIGEESESIPEKIVRVEVAELHSKPESPVKRETPMQNKSVSENSIRVDVALLDKLMNLVGELVLARNQILQFSTVQHDSIFLATSQKLNLITTELQEGVMKTRMQPIGNIWSKFPRVARDLAMLCKKQVQIEMEGKETELDKTIIEAIKDPLTHIIRNSIDHGIELPEKRIAMGKPAEGRLFLRAFHEGGQVNIEISDDGGGIDSEKVRQKAIQKNLITADQASRMGERELTNLIFLPGFSTAEQVTNVSGRGVGMDVVKTNIEKIGGMLDIHSKFGKGTTLKIKIPLTLAIIPALIVTTQKNRYAIPQVNLLELVRLEEESAQLGIEMIHGTPVYRLRGNLLPLVYLNEELKAKNSNSSGDGSTNIVILQADDRQFGLVVDEINDTEEIVVKPLGKQLKGLSAFAGATIMGDGKVALILDILGIAQKASVVAEIRDRSIVEKLAKTQENAERQTVLLFTVGGDGVMAIPLSTVARLEEFSNSEIEITERQEVVQYRDQIMPLLRLCNVLGLMRNSSFEPTNSVQVVVYSERGKSIGIVVDQILDIVEDTVAIKYHSTRQGILGSAVIQNRVTDLIDLHGIVSSFDSTFFEELAVTAGV